MKYSARSTLLVLKTGATCPSPWATRDNTANTPAASGAVPYVMSWLSWLARSSFSLGTRLGTLAEAAGFQN